MVMNNIICFRDVILVLPTQQRCHLCTCKVVDSKNQRKLCTRTFERATVALDRLCQELAHPL